ncbi:NAD-dependent epimerase/dehydratase family protein [Candidatus Bathyarchaeota archaeon]|nr:MAG: NAD-dependent epimerase/dehydratase family protein [Candidatus Bathyarchaeota archaeon]
MKRIMVTGGLGFIGSNLVDHLISTDEVTVLDDLSSGRISNVSRHLRNPKFRFVKGSVLNPGMIDEAIGGASAVVHLAAVVSVALSIEKPLLAHRVNVEGTLNVLESCLKHSVEKFVFASSAAVYGNDLTPPFREDCRSNPSNLYGATKGAGEAYVKAYAQTHNLKTVILRLMNVYGPRRSPGPYAGVITKFAEAISLGKPLTVYGDGEQTRDFVHVSDAIEAMTRALHKEQAIGHTFNIGTGRPTTVSKLAAIFSHLTEPRSQITHMPERIGEVRASWSNIEKAKEVLGYQPKVSLENGIKSFIQWYNNDENSLKADGE